MCLQDRAAETNTREPGQQFQVFHQITSGPLQVNDVVHQHNAWCTRGPPCKRKLSAVLAYLALLNVAGGCLVQFNSMC